MDVHLLFKVLLEYGGELEDWCTFRALCTETRDYTKRLHYSTDLYGRKNFIQLYVCQNCGKHTIHTHMLRYKLCPSDIVVLRVIVHCGFWKCHVSAIMSMIANRARNGVCSLKTELPLLVSVPRSDGTVTDGKCTPEIVRKDVDTYYMYTFWNKEGLDYSKWLPVSDLDIICIKNFITI